MPAIGQRVELLSLACSCQHLPHGLRAVGLLLAELLLVARGVQVQRRAQLALQLDQGSRGRPAAAAPQAEERDETLEVRVAV